MYVKSISTGLEKHACNWKGVGVGVGLVSGISFPFIDATEKPISLLCIEELYTINATQR
jgi:hypothetical protein